jgi:hypothetical protein
MMRVGVTVWFGWGGVVVIESVFLQILAAAVSYDYWVFCVCSVFFNDVS